jgi:hypothetical protein
MKHFLRMLGLSVLTATAASAHSSKQTFEPAKAPANLTGSHDFDFEVGNPDFQFELYQRTFGRAPSSVFMRV